MMLWQHLEYVRGSTYQWTFTQGFHLQTLQTPISHAQSSHLQPPTTLYISADSVPVRKPAALLLEFPRGKLYSCLASQYA